MALEEHPITRELGGADRRAFDDLVAGISCTLYRNELRRGGWAADIGILGPNLFAPDVARALQAGNRHLWTITAGEQVEQPATPRPRQAGE